MPTCPFIGVYKLIWVHIALALCGDGSGGSVYIRVCGDGSVM